MRDDAIRALLRLRQIAQDEARLLLSGCLERESATAGRVRVIERAIQTETEHASSLDGSDATVETFAVWLRRARADLADATGALQEAEAQTHEARAVLNASRSAVEAVEAELRRREVAQQVDADRREQHALDEVGSRTVR